MAEPIDTMEDEVLDATEEPTTCSNADLLQCMCLAPQ